MRKSHFTKAQVFGMLKEQEAGMPTAQVSTVSLGSDRFRVRISRVVRAAKFAINNDVRVCVHTSPR